MSLKTFCINTSIVFMLNGSLDAMINDNYGTAKAAPNYYIIDYLMNRDNPNYTPYIKLDWKTFK